MGQPLTLVGTTLSASLGRPSATGLDRNSGLAGTSVTIYGTNFVADATSNTVSLNGVQATVLGATGTKIKVLVPVGATTGLFSVTTGIGTGTGFDIFYVQ